VRTQLNKIIFLKGERMKNKKSVVGAIILSGAVGLASTSVWSQEVPGERRQSDPTQTRPGQQDVPGINQLGTPELSRNDMRAVEEALQAKGYKPGKIDGVADDEARAAIRAFQKDNGFSVTGMVDQKTADQLGVKINTRSGSAQRDRSTSGTSGQSGSRSDTHMKKSGDDQSLPPAATQ
jgi:peptidoglycan hydrolase-like protein with peptidoglycan-binding domain